MQAYFAVATMVLLIIMVILRVLMMQHQGIKAMKFGEIDKRDFLIPPFAVFYFYLIFSNAFHWPQVSEQAFFRSELIGWIGILCCAAGLILSFFSLLSFGKSFRVGIDEEQPDKLVTTGVFVFSRNPIYTAFGFVLLGQFLVFPNWILVVYLALGIWLFHRQILREEAFLKKHYGKEYLDYCSRVRRYI
jgi:protein-S-isoprenylcysteine O-methyltransferase Ste14